MRKGGKAKFVCPAGYNYGQNCLLEIPKSAFASFIIEVYLVDFRPAKGSIGNFTVLKKIGSGASCKVYKAEAPNGQRVAIKMFLEDIQE